MTYLELFQKAECLLNRNDITLGEFEKMLEPLNREIRDIIPCSECRWYSNGLEEYVDGKFVPLPNDLCVLWEKGTERDGYCHRAKKRGS